jgi:hypothetical protein
VPAPKPPPNGGSHPPTLEQSARDTFARRDEVITRREAEAETTRLLALQAEENHLLSQRIGQLETWRANLVGRGVGLAVIGAVLVAVCASVITRLILGGGA